MVETLKELDKTKRELAMANKIIHSQRDRFLDIRMNQEQREYADKVVREWKEIY